jgi:hypothetical protein
LFDHHLGLLQRIEDLALQAFILQLAVEALKRIENWSLTSLQQRLVKTGGRLAESHLTWRLFGSMVRRIAGLSVPAG